MSKIVKALIEAMDSGQESVTTFRQNLDSASVNELEDFHAVTGQRMTRIKAAAARVGYSIPARPTAEELGDPADAETVPADIPQTNKPPKTTRTVRRSKK